MVVDTSVFMQFLRSADKQKTVLFKVWDTSQVYVSSVTYFELLAGATDKQKLKDVERLVKYGVMLPFNDDVARKAAEIYLQLRATNTLIEFRGIFIAATAIVHDLKIVTLNKKHFGRVKGLKFHDQ